MIQFPPSHPHRIVVRVALDFIVRAKKVFQILFLLIFLTFLKWDPLSIIKYNRDIFFKVYHWRDKLIASQRLIFTQCEVYN